MIVEVSGNVNVKTVSEGTVSMIVSTTGTAYGKKGKIKSIIRFFRKAKNFIVTKTKTIVEVVVSLPLVSKTGKPSCIEPPVKTINQ